MFKEFTMSIMQTIRQAFGIGSIQDAGTQSVSCDLNHQKFFDYGLLEKARLNAKTSYAKKILALAPVKRQQFDAMNPMHRAAYSMFLKTGHWNIHFYTEWPALTVPHTIQQKLVELALADNETIRAIKVLSDSNIKQLPVLIPRLATSVASMVPTRFLDSKTKIIVNNENRRIETGICV